MAELRRLGIVVFRETQRTWTARALEHDLASHGRTMESALDTLLKLIRAHVAYDRGHSRPPLSAFAAAPTIYWNAFDQAAELPLRMEVDWQDTGVPGPVVVALASERPGQPFMETELGAIANVA